MQNHVAEVSGGGEDTTGRREPENEDKHFDYPSEEIEEECVGLQIDPPDKSFVEGDDFIRQEGGILNGEVNSVTPKSKPIPIPVSSQNGSMGNGNIGNEIITQDVSSSLPNQNIFRLPNVNKMATQTAFTAMMSIWEPVRSFVSRLQNLNETPMKFSFPKFSLPSWMWGDSKEKDKKCTDDIKIDLGSDDDDLFAIGNMPTSHNFQGGSSQNRQRYMSDDLFMGRYTEQDIWKIINELKPFYFGKTIRQLLESKGYKDIALEMDTSDPFVHKLNLYYVGNLKRKEDKTKESTTENGTFSLTGASSSTTSSSSSSSSTSSQSENSGSFWSSFFNNGGNTKKKEDNDDNGNGSTSNDSETSGGGSSGIWPFSLLGTRTPDKKKKEQEERKSEKETIEEKEKKREKEQDRMSSDSEELIRSPSPTTINIMSPPVSQSDLFQNVPIIETKEETSKEEELHTQTKQSPATDKLFALGDNETGGCTKSLLTDELESGTYESDNSTNTNDTLEVNNTTLNTNDSSIIEDDKEDEEDDEDDEGTDHKKFSPNKLLAQLFVRRETTFSVMETKSFTCKESGVPKFYAKAFSEGLLVLRNFFKTEKLQMIVIEWLRMQDPLKSFGERTPLPGQLHPGLGLGNEAAKILCSLARNKGRDGILNLPEHFYNAYLYAQGFNLYHFLNPAFEGYFKSICKAIEPDIKERGISAVAWAVFRGMLHCRMPDDDSDLGVPVTPSRIKWVSQEQVCPLSGRMNKYFKSSEYANAVKKAYHPEAFFIMWEQLEDDSFISTSCPN